VRLIIRHVGISKYKKAGKFAASTGCPKAIQLHGTLLLTRGSTHGPRSQQLNKFDIWPAHKRIFACVPLPPISPSFRFLAPLMLFCLVDFVNCWMHLLCCCMKFFHCLFVPNQIVMKSVTSFIFLALILSITVVVL